MGLMGWTANAADFNLVAYTGHYVYTPYPEPGYGWAVQDLAYIPVGPNGWQRITQECFDPPGLCEPEQLEIFLYISTDKTTKGVGGIDLMDGNSLPPSGIFSGNPGAPDPYVTINNRAYWKKPPLPGAWTKVDGETDAQTWDGQKGYSAEEDSWYFGPFDKFALGAVQEDPSPAPGSNYAGNFYKGVGLQWDATNGWTDEMLGSGGVLVPYIHLVINKEAMPCGELTWITISGLPALIDGTRPATLDWLGQQFAVGGAPVVPTGRLEVYCIPEPASVILLALAGIPAILRRRR
jgi:hypothetical protein